jgi:hypothetical protein
MAASSIAARIRSFHPLPVARDEAVGVLFVLFSFQSFGVIAGEGRTPQDVVPLVQRIARLIVGAG